MSPYNKNDKNLVILIVAIYNRFGTYSIRESYSLVVTRVWPQFSLRWWPGKKNSVKQLKNHQFTVSYSDYKVQTAFKFGLHNFSWKLRKRLNSYEIFSLHASTFAVATSSIQKIYDVDQQSRLCKSIFIAL